MKKFFTKLSFIPIISVSSLYAMDPPDLDQPKVCVTLKHRNQDARSKFQKGKDFIDAYLESYERSKTEVFRVQLSEIYDFTTKSIAQNQKLSHFPFAAAQALVEGREPIFEEDTKKAQAFIMAAALKKIKEVTSQKEIEGADFLKAVEAASLFLSPELLPSDNPPSPYFQGILIEDVPIYCAVNKLINLYHCSGIVSFEKDENKKTPEIQLKAKEEHNAFRFGCNFFIPLVLFGEDATFTHHLYLYALSKGITLYGLTNKCSLAHGGLYKYPVYFFTHDHAHQQDFLPKLNLPPNKEDHHNARVEHFRTTLSFTNCIIALSEQLYKVIHNPDVMKEEEREKAATASYFLLHENSHIKKTVEFINDPNATFERFLGEIIKTFSSHLDSWFPLIGDADIYLKRTRRDFRSSTLKCYDKNEIALNVLSQRYSSNINFINVGDLSLTITEWLYEGQPGNGPENADNYHALRMQKLILSLCDWFYEKVKDRIDE